MASKFFTLSDVQPAIFPCSTKDAAERYPKRILVNCWIVIRGMGI